MFKDSQEGQTHYENDGCGIPEHNKDQFADASKKADHPADTTSPDWEARFDKEFNVGRIYNPILKQTEDATAFFDKITQVAKSPNPERIKAFIAAELEKARAEGEQAGRKKDLEREALEAAYLIKCEAVIKSEKRIMETCAESEQRGRTAAIGNIGAKLLAKHSPQIVLDAYFDAANEELEANPAEHESDN